METKNLAKGNGRLYCYFPFLANLDCLEKIARDEVASLYIFFRAKNMELITSNVDSVKEDCVGDTPLHKIPMKKRVKFITGDPMEFTGTATGVVKIEERKFLEIEIIPGKLYFYSWINIRSECSLLKLAT